MTHQERLSASAGWNAVYYFSISVYFRLSERGVERGHKLNGLVHSIKRWLVWLGSRPKYNILRSATGGFLMGIWEEVKVRFYVRLLVRFLVFLGLTHRGRAWPRREHFKAHTSFRNWFGWKRAWLEHFQKKQLSLHYVSHHAQKRSVRADFKAWQLGEKGCQARDHCSGWSFNICKDIFNLTYILSICPMFVTNLVGTDVGHYVHRRTWKSYDYFFRTN